MIDLDLDFIPPAYPPPLLTDEQVLSLCRQGWLSISVPDQLRDGYKSLTATASTFFDQEKVEKSNLYPPAQGTEWGYYHIENEKEYVTLRCNVHAESSIEVRAAQIWRDTALLLQRILSDISRAMCIDWAAWDAMLDGTVTLPTTADDMTPTLLRLFRYFPSSGFAGEHTDIGILTLCMGSGRGLQVADRSEAPVRWIDAEGPTILIGDTLRIFASYVLGNSRVRSGLHRVVENPNGRHSAVFALRPSLRGPVDLALFYGEGLLDQADLWDEIRGRKLNINAQKNIRDLQRKNMAARRQRRSSSDRATAADDYVTGMS